MDLGIILLVITGVVVALYLLHLLDAFLLHHFFGELILGTIWQIKFNIENKFFNKNENFLTSKIRNITNALDEKPSASKAKTLNAQLSQYTASYNALKPKFEEKKKLNSEKVAKITKLEIAEKKRFENRMEPLMYARKRIDAPLKNKLDKLTGRWLKFKNVFKNFLSEQNYKFAEKMRKMTKGSGNKVASMIINGFLSFFYILIIDVLFGFQIWLAILLADFAFKALNFFAFLPRRIARFFQDLPSRFRLGWKEMFIIHRADTISGYLYVLPVLILAGLFLYYPIINTFIMSFQGGYNMINGSFRNWTINAYTRIFSDSDFIMAIKNTFFLVFVAVPISTVVALAISVALNGIKLFKGFFQTVFYLPYITNTIAIGLVFRVLFNDGKDGLFNAFLRLFGQEMNFFGSAGGQATWGSVMLVITIYTIWSALAFKIMLLIGALQGVSNTYYQAAKLDGASKWRSITKITLPLISPTIFYVLTTSFINTFKTYTSVVALYGETLKPFGALSTENFGMTIVGFIMTKFTNSASGSVTLAAAGAVILLIIILIFTGIQMSVSKKHVHY